MNQSFFVVKNSFFRSFSLTTLVTHGKFHVDNNKLLMRKSCQLHFATIAKRNFHPSGVFQTAGENGDRDGGLLTVEKEEASTFQAADLATTVADMLAESYY